MIKNPLISDFKFEHKMITTGTLYLEVSNDLCLVDSHHVHLVLQTSPLFSLPCNLNPDLSCWYSRETKSLLYPLSCREGTSLLLLHIAIHHVTYRVIPMNTVMLPGHRCRNGSITRPRSSQSIEHFRTISSQRQSSKWTMTAQFRTPRHPPPANRTPRHPLHKRPVHPRQKQIIYQLIPDNRKNIVQHAIHHHFEVQCSRTKIQFIRQAAAFSPEPNT